MARKKSPKSPKKLPKLPKKLLKISRKAKKPAKSAKKHGKRRTAGKKQAKKKIARRGLWTFLKKKSAERKLSWKQKRDAKRARKEAEISVIRQKIMRESKIHTKEKIPVQLPAKAHARKIKGKVPLLPKKLKEKPVKIEYLKTGITGFDELLKEGIPEGSSILVEGGPGSGKTIFCLDIARNMCKQGKKVLYMSFEEPEYRLRSHMSKFGTDAHELEAKKQLYIRRFNALDIARSVEALLSEAKKELLIDVQPVLIPHDFEPDIVLVDSLTSIGSAFSGEESRFRIYMEQLFRYLESHQITSFLIRETSSPTHIGTSFVEKAEAVSFLSDGIIALYNVFLPGGQRKRALEIIKMRGVSIDRKVVECEIVGGKGFVIYPNKPLKINYRLT